MKSLCSRVAVAWVLFFGVCADAGSLTCLDSVKIAPCSGLLAACKELSVCSSVNRKATRCDQISSHFSEFMASPAFCPECSSNRSTVAKQLSVCESILAKQPHPAASPSAVAGVALSPGVPVLPSPMDQPLPPNCFPNNLVFPNATGVGVGCDLAKGNCPCTYQPCSHVIFPYPAFEGYLPKPGTLWAVKKTGNKLIPPPFSGQDEYSYCVAKLCAKNQPEALRCIGPEWK